jgi:metal-dependent amidase/aminoacylase/carboxypeptidase family protein
VVSVTKVVGGDAYNVIPETATISGTARFFTREVGEQIEEAMRRVAEGVAAGFGATATLSWRLIFAPTINDAAQTDAYAEAAADLVGADKVARDNPPGMGSEDFSFMMEKVPGAYIHVGNGPGATPHNPRYQFNDAAIPYGAALYARVVERGLSRDAAG